VKKSEPITSSSDPSREALGITRSDTDAGRRRDDTHSPRQRVRHQRQRSEPHVEPHARLRRGAGDVRLRPRAHPRRAVLPGRRARHGFTLRATLDLLRPDATVVVAELVPAVVDWNRGPLGPLARHPLKDKRVVVEIGDVAATLGSSTGRFDVVLLDVDNSPAAFTASHNAVSMTIGPRRRARGAQPGGVLAVWSSREDRRFEQRLRHGGFDVDGGTRAGPS